MLALFIRVILFNFAYCCRLFRSLLLTFPSSPLFFRQLKSSLGQRISCQCYPTTTQHTHTHKRLSGASPRPRQTVTLSQCQCVPLSAFDLLHTMGKNGGKKPIRNSGHLDTLWGCVCVCVPEHAHACSLFYLIDNFHFAFVVTVVLMCLHTHTHTASHKHCLTHTHTHICYCKLIAEKLFSATFLNFEAPSDGHPHISSHS